MPGHVRIHAQEEVGENNEYDGSNTGLVLCVRYVQGTSGVSSWLIPRPMSYSTASVRSWKTSWKDVGSQMAKHETDASDPEFQALLQELDVPKWPEKDEDDD